MGCGDCFLFCITIESCLERGPSPTVTRPQFPQQSNPREPPGAICGGRRQAASPSCQPWSYQHWGGNRGTGVQVCVSRAGPSCCHQPRLQDFIESSGPPIEGGYSGQSVVRMGKLRPREGEERTSPSPGEAEQGLELGCLEPTCCGAHRHSPSSMWATPTWPTHVAPQLGSLCLWER